MSGWLEGRKYELADSFEVASVSDTAVLILVVGHLVRYNAITSLRIFLVDLNTRRYIGLNIRLLHATLVNTP